MAHEFETGFFVGDKAWHGLGNLLTVAPKTTAEVLKQSGLDWEVIPSPIAIAPGAKLPKPTAQGDTWTSTYQALVRSSDHRILAVRDQFYKPLQNAEAAGFFSHLVAEGDATWEAAGSLRGGRRVWFLVKIAGSEAAVRKNDTVARYLTLCNGHDGTLKVTIMYTDIRIVCMNTMRMALAAGEASAIKILHSQRLGEALAEVRSMVELSRRTFELSLDQYRSMAARELKIEGLQQYVRKVFAPADVAIEDAQKMPRPWELIERNFEAGVGAELAGRTVWGAYNAVTEYLDHQSGVRNVTTPSTRLDSAWFGKNARVRETARTEALALCK